MKGAFSQGSRSSRFSGWRYLPLLQHQQKQKERTSPSLASPLSGGSRATTLDLAASPLPPLPPRRHQRHPPGKPGASPRKVAAGPLLLRFSSGGRRNPGRRPRSVRRHRLLGWWWRGCGPVGLAARAASSPADEICGAGGGASGLLRLQIWPPLPPSAALRAPPLQIWSGSTWFSGAWSWMWCWWCGALTGRNPWRRRPWTPLPFLEAPFRSFAPPPLPLASRVKARTLLGGDGALGSVCFLKSSPWMLFGLWALRCGGCLAAATVCPKWRRRQLGRSGSVRVSSGALCATGDSLVRRPLARRGSGSPPPAATVVQVVSAGASFLGLGPASSLLRPPWTPCCCLTGIFLLSKGSSVGSGDAVFLVKFLSHVGCALFLLLLVASFHPCSRVSNPYVDGSAPFEPGEEAGASFDSGNGW